MNILAFDTSSTHCSVALSVGGVLQEKDIIAPMQQAELILPMIDNIKSLLNIELNQLDAIAFGCGPGSFTGIRLATSIAQGLGYALQVPLIPISSLAALAQAAYNHLGWEELFVAMDARIQEVYCAQYQINQDGIVELQGQERVCSPSQVQVPTDLTDWYGVGNAWDIYSDQLSFSPLNRESSELPIASAIIQLAIPSMKAKTWLSPAQALPVYLRDEVATKEKKR